MEGVVSLDVCIERPLSIINVERRHSSTARYTKASCIKVSMISFMKEHACNFYRVGRFFRSVRKCY